MAKRTRQSSDQGFEERDNPIGLTQAFDPVTVDESKPYDDPVGLTQAFGPVADDEAPDWDSSEKWNGFDWSAPAEEGESAEDREAALRAWQEAANADESKRFGRGRHARHAAPASEAEAAAAASPDAGADEAAGASAESAADGKPVVSERMERSRRTRKRLVVTIVLLLLVVIALGIVGFRLVVGYFPFFEQPPAAEQELESSADALEPVAPSGQDAQEVAVQIVDTPDLTPLFGKTVDEAIALLQRGAIVTSSGTSSEGDEGVIKKSVTIELADEPGNPRSGGSPKVYLGLNEEDKIVQVGYSAPAGALGYGTLNFQDAVAEEHIIEKTLQAIGANVQEGTVKLPDDVKQYTTYGADGTTVVRERYAFDGDVDAAGVPCSWSAVLSYDYTSANISGNPSETVRLIYVYLTQK